eukprot:TRINITY_DN12522_c0_g1_i1.p1 TRINITY_DN12522_c0_g1~~TRINITY_DN12522_c0_g1_i1.p1  ORF type:complete len:371 (+),score=70.27 TRINITY_DN12522_c0_g1_i1:64-1176(+)
MASLLATSTHAASTSRGSAAAAAAVWPVPSEQEELEFLALDEDLHVVTSRWSGYRRLAVAATVAAAATLGVLGSVLAYTPRQQREVAAAATERAVELRGHYGGGHPAVRAKIQQWKPACGAANEEVERLRDLHWPRRRAKLPALIKTVLWLNHDEDEELKQSFEEHIAGLAKTPAAAVAHWKFQRVSALDDDDIKQRGGNSGFSAESHMRALRAAKEIFDADAHSHGLILIMGDEAQVNRHFEGGWGFFRHLLPEDFDCVRVASYMQQGERCEYAFNRVMELSVYTKGERPSAGCGAYVVSRTGVDHLLDRFVTSLANAEACELTCDELLGYATPSCEIQKQVPELKIYSVAHHHHGLVGPKAQPVPSEE